MQTEDHKDLAERLKEHIDQFQANYGVVVCGFHFDEIITKEDDMNNQKIDILFEQGDFPARDEKTVIEIAAALTVEQCQFLIDHIKREKKAEALYWLERVNAQATQKAKIERVTTAIRELTAEPGE